MCPKLAAQPGFSSPVCIRSGVDSASQVRLGHKVYQFLKRVVDILFSLLVICLVLSWMTPVLALLIKLDSPGPVFFLQRRIGRFGKPFVCFKFRTMLQNDWAHSLPAGEEDPRITRLGKWIRKPGIDELPQFINVLIGNMSIIGPRPHMLADDRLFASVLPGYRIRSLVKPGITGLSQVMGCRGFVANNEAIYRRWRWDSFYVRNADMALDSRIAIRTLKVMSSSIRYPVKPGRTIHGKAVSRAESQFNNS